MSFKFEEDEKVMAEVKPVTEKLRAAVNPKNDQLRSLDREIGGLEAEETKEIDTKDVWDDRSEEVDKMGSTHVFTTSGGRSDVWQKKRKKLDAAKHGKEDHTPSSEVKPAGHLNLKEAKRDLDFSFSSGGRSDRDGGHGR